MNSNNVPGDARDETYATAVSALTKAGGHMAGYVHTRRGFQFSETLVSSLTSLEN